MPGEVYVNYVGIDQWNRPIFKEIRRNNYYGATNVLFARDTDRCEVLRTIRSNVDLTFFGSSFGCEPLGTPVTENIVIMEG